MRLRLKRRIGLLHSNLSQMGTRERDGLVDPVSSAVGSRIACEVHNIFNKLLCWWAFSKALAVLHTSLTISICFQKEMLTCSIHKCVLVANMCRTALIISFKQLSNTNNWTTSPIATRRHIFGVIVIVCHLILILFFYLKYTLDEQDGWDGNFAAVGHTGGFFHVDL